MRETLAIQFTVIGVLKSSRVCVQPRENNGARTLNIVSMERLYQLIPGRPNFYQLDHHHQCVRELCTLARDDEN